MQNHTSQLITMVNGAAPSCTSVPKVAFLSALTLLPAPDSRILTIRVIILDLSPIEISN